MASSKQSQDSAAARAARAAELRRQLDQASYEYHVLDQPTIADSAYDALFRELQELEAAHAELRSPDSPTQRVGALPQSQLPKHSHLVPMLSLANAFTDDEVGAWDERIERLVGDAVHHTGYTAELKIDGRSGEQRDLSVDGVAQLTGDARQRIDRRGRHTQSAHDPRRPASAALRRSPTALRP